MNNLNTEEKIKEDSFGVSSSPVQIQACRCRFHLPCTLWSSVDYQAHEPLIRSYLLLKFEEYCFDIS